MFKKMMLASVAGVLLLSACAAAATPSPTAVPPAPTAAPKPTEVPKPTAVPMVAKDIVDTAVGAGTFKTLATAR